MLAHVDTEIFYMICMIKFNTINFDREICVVNIFMSRMKQNEIWFIYIQRQSIQPFIT